MSNLQAESVAAILTLASFVYTFWPESVFANQREKTHLDDLLERKDRIFDNLRNLNFEYQAGKCEEEDFLIQQAQLEIEVSTVMTEIIDLQKD